MPPNELAELKIQLQDLLDKVTFVQVLHMGLSSPIREEERQ
jgi:hypothetical protein